MDDELLLPGTNKKLSLTHDSEVQSSQRGEVSVISSKFERRS